MFDAGFFDVVPRSRIVTLIPSPRWMLLAAFLAIAMEADLQAEQPSQSIPTRTQAIGDITFTLPQHLTVERIVDEANCQWPVVADWDDQGRLVVVESGGVSRPIDQHNALRLHRVVRFEDADQDGTYERRILAADQLPFAEGVLCIGNQMLVAAPPEIWLLTDEEGDGYCEKREIWFDAKTITGCANDLHGPYEGPDGWIYWCKGAFAEQTHQLTNGKTLRTTAAHIFRRKLAGGPIESVVAGGMDNPVEVAFIPSGERFFTSTFLQHPSDGVRDGITQAVYGGLHGKQHDVIQGHWRTGALMPVTKQFAAAAPSGLSYLRSKQLTSPVVSDEYPALAAALFNYHKVTLHALRSEGAGFSTIDFDLLSSDRIDFHPTDILEAADGSLVVIDTGGWYDLCCPSSRVDQKAAAGGIYRISIQYSDEHPAEMSNVPAIAAVDPVTRRLAVRQVVEKGDAAIAELQANILSTSLPTAARCDALWVLCRIGSASALQSIVQILQRDDLPLEIRTASANALSLHRFAPSSILLQQIVTDSELGLPLRRAAAEALGRIGDPSVLSSLMTAFDTAGGDRNFEHSLLYAMLELQQHEAMAGYLAEGLPSQQRAALVVLEQVHPEALDSTILVQLARAEDQPLRAVALAVLGKQLKGKVPANVVQQLHDLWQQEQLEATDVALIKAIVAGGSDDERLREEVASWLREIPGQEPSRVVVMLEVLQQTGGNQLPGSWQQPLGQWLLQSDATTRRQLAAWLRPRTTRMDTTAENSLVQILLQLATTGSDNESDRLRFVATLPMGTMVDDDSFNQSLLNALLQTEDDELGAAAFAAIQRVRLSKAYGERLVRSLDQIRPLHLFAVLQSIIAIGDRDLITRTLTKMETVKAARTLTSDQVQSLARNQDDELKQQALTLDTNLHAAPKDIRQAVEIKLAELKPGDPVRGYQVFRSSKAACSACHRIGYVGSHVGPDLSQIGRSRTAYDLLEAIMFPSARLEQSYQPTRIVTSDGRVLNGLVTSQSGERLELLLAAGESIVIDTNVIEERSDSEVSIMPSGLVEQLSREELADLLALLQATN